MHGLLIRDAEVEGARCDLRCEAGCVVALASGLAAEPGDLVVEAAGGALLPGLHDHHLHLLAWAAAETSVRCGPPEVRGEAEFAAALARAASAAPAAEAREALARAASAAPAAEAREAPGAAISDWVRGVGYHESVAGPLDRERLDALAPGRALRIQHRSGALWMLSSEAVRRLGLDAGTDAPGVERDARGLATGRLFRLDAWLRQRLGDEAPPPLAPLGLRLARFGVTGVTDATPELGPVALAALGDAVRGGALPQRLVLLGAAKPGEGFALGPRKLVLDERALPALDELAGAFEQTHAEGRAVAVHCVTRAELVLALAAFDAAGARAGDRIEHASVAPPDALEWIARLALTVVTQPGFVRTRGDDYLREVEPHDRPWLYRCAGFESKGVALGAGTDAPFGDPDPWLAMQAAVDRRTAAGQRLGVDEGLSPERALGLFTSAAQEPGGPPRRIALGAAADLCLLDRPWARARDALTHNAVAATFRAGRPLFRSR